VINWITLAPSLALISYLVILFFQFETWMKSGTGRLFAFYLFIAALYALSSWMMHKGMPPSPLFWFKVEMASIIPMMPLLPHIAVAFTKSGRRLWGVILATYIVAAVFLALLFSDKIVKDVKIVPGTGGMVNIEFAAGMILVWILTTLTLLFTMAICINSLLRESDVQKKNLIKYPLMGTFIIFLGGLMNAFPTLRSYPFDLVGNSMYAILVAYSILRFQFLSPGSIFRKSSVYFFIAVSLSAIFIYVLSRVLPLVDEMPGWQLWLLFSPLVLLILLMTTPVRQRFQIWLDRLFFGEQYSYRLTIENFSKKASSSLDFHESTRSLVGMLSSVFHCPVALFFSQEKEEVLHLVEVVGVEVKEPEKLFLLRYSPVIGWLINAGKPLHSYSIRATAGPAGIMAADLKWMDAIDSELVCPLIFNDKLSGIILLGKKKGAYPYSDEDVSLLSTLSSQIAIALDNARLYLESQQAYKELLAAQEHLMHSERMRLLGEVSSGVAHDLNNHLAVISARAEMSLPLIDDPQAHRNTELILKAAEDCANVVKRLREFVKKPKDLLQDKLEVNKVIMELLPMVEHRRSEIEQTRGVFYEMNYELQARGDIMGNGSELRQAMVNIIFNAFDAMPNGGRIEIVSQDKYEWVVISIRDTGIGMTEEVKEKIFKPFFTTKGEKGSGLGLSIALGIVNKHGGKLTFESEPGKGTTFYLTFPVASQARGNGKGETREPALSGNSKRILVIEDNKELGESVTFFLNQAGYNAVLATEGTDGLAKFQADNFNMVVTDWGLSPMTGGDVALSIKAMNASVPIVVMTGWELSLSPAVLKDMGIVDVIIKPFAREEFLGRIARIVSSS